MLAAGYAVAVLLLWRTKVPGDLRLPHVDPRKYFSAAHLRAAASYSRFERIDALLGELVLVAVLAVYARRGAALMRESAAGRIGTGMLLAMLGLGFVWLAQLPFGLADLWWQRRHHVSHLGYVTWIWVNWVGLGSQFLFICLAILIVMGLAGRLPRYWWIPGAAVFVGLTLLFAFVTPWLIVNTHRLRDPQLVATARQLARAEGVPNTRVEVQEVRTETSAPNAEAVGIGPGRRVVLWDTLLDGRFNVREIRVVLAHEFGHLARNHIWKSVAWYALFALPGAFLIAVATRRRGGMARPEAVPLALFVLVALQFVAQPAQVAISRHLESEADWLALQTTRDPTAARQLFRDLGQAADDQPSPPLWDYILFENHPTIAQRIAMVEAWRARNR
ncbi:MAG TPA: M48 family metalloprotease [Gaiellaceae bacterium]